jgi:hypothetical protein
MGAEVSRSYIYQLLKTDAHSTAPGSLGVLGVEPAHIYAGDTDEPRGRQFIILRYGPLVRGISQSNRVELVVWAYDRDKDHDAVEVVQKRVREILEVVEAQKTAEGWITTIVWTGNSPDLYDDAYRAVGINSGYQVIASGR